MILKLKNSRKSEKKKYSDLRILKPIEDCDWERYEKAWEELSDLFSDSELVKNVFDEQKTFSFSYYLKKPIKLDSYNKIFGEKWKEEYPDKIDEHDKEANKELDHFIGKVDTLSKYSSWDRCEEWFKEIPLTYSVDMKDRRLITFYFKDIEQGLEYYLDALRTKCSQISDAQLQTAIISRESK